MQQVKYAVIILNYNTIDDAINAAESVKNNAINGSYIICIADNGSSNKKDREKCGSYYNDHVTTVCLDKNNGYATGNDKAIHFLRQSFDPQYYVIMNPDVLLMKKGTIEKMIERVESRDEEIVGGQPLVWNCFYSDHPELQQNIRRVPDYKDLCMLSLLPLKVLERKRYRMFTYANDMPYRKEIEYRVPSGAFFLIKAPFFEKIGLFDPNTFLYYEEHIIGKKLELNHKKMLFMPQFIVRHEHGKSTGNNHTSINKFAEKCGLESRIYFARKYLGCSRRQVKNIIVLTKINVLFQYAKVSISRLKKL